MEMNVRLKDQSRTHFRNDCCPYVLYRKKGGQRAEKRAGFVLPKARVAPGGVGKELVMLW